MRNLICLLGVSLALLTWASIPTLSIGHYSVSSIGSPLTNTIDGIVWDPSGRPVPDIYVELQNEMLMSLNRTRTTSSGHFSFSVVNPGNYVIKVLATGTRYMDASETVEIVDVTQRSSDQQYVDIYLKIDKRKVTPDPQGVAETVFAQEVPDAARRQFETGVKDVQAGRQEGMDEIDLALKVFPEYFLALNFMGREYVERKEYEKALPYLIKALDVNQKSFSTYYNLAYACYQLQHRPEALKAARAATILQPNSLNAQLLYGTLLRLEADYPNAEKALLKAQAAAEKGQAIPDVHFQLALLYNRTGHNKEAIDQINAYLKDYPDSPNKQQMLDLIEQLKKEIK